MTDARLALQQLRDEAGASYDTHAIHGDLAAVEQRVESARRWRAVVSAAAVVLVASAGFLALRHINEDPISPAQSPSPHASRSETVGATPEWCHEATVVAGKSVGDLAGFEGWFNGTPSAPCDEWEQQIKDHPDTVYVNTMDNTMVEAYYRTNIDALGIYGTLSGDFEVPDPNPSWPADSAVLIDTRTGEVLASERFADMEGFDVTTGHFETVTPSP